MLVSERGEVRLEKTEAASRKVNGKVYSFTLAPEQLQELHVLLGDGDLLRSGNDVQHPYPSRESTIFSVEYYDGHAFQHVMATQDDMRAFRPPLKKFEKWFREITREKREQSKTLKPDNCSAF